MENVESWGLLEGFVPEDVMVREPDPASMKHVKHPETGGEQLFWKLLVQDLGTPGRGRKRGQRWAVEERSRLESPLLYPTF